ncbi:MAG: hypothetical protein GY953_09840 [bacterium]|nr:hypothetical protein [bacterium]
MVQQGTAPQKEETSSQFQIDVEFQGGLTPGQQQAFDVAAKRWSEIVVGDVPDVRIGNVTIDDVSIDARGTFIDGDGSILGQAGPRCVRTGTLLPATGSMVFDTADLDRM